MIFDTHSHLFMDEFNDDYDLCIKRCIDNKINNIMLVGYSIESSIKAMNYAKGNPMFYCSCGIHPSEVGDINKDMEWLTAFISNNKVDAIGEIGLDYHFLPFDKEVQLTYFERQIEIAIKFNLPIIVHMRDATNDCYNLLLKYKGKIRGVMHCYSGSYEMALKFIELGFYIGLGGPVTYKNAVMPKLVAKSIPIDKLLTETDCPYLPPVPFRGKRNESSFIVYTIKEIALLREVSEDVVITNSYSNAIKLFGKKGN